VTARSAPCFAAPPTRESRGLQLEEIKALLAASHGSNWLGGPDQALMLTMVLTGVRVTELITLTVGDVSLGTGAHINIHQGKAGNEGRSPLPPDRRGVAPMPTRAPGPARGPAVPHPATRGAQPPHPRAADLKTRSHRRRPQLVDQRQAHHPAHAPAHQRGSSEPAGSTSRPSPCGSATNTSRPPASTNTPTPRSKNKHSPDSRRSEPNPAMSGRHAGLLLRATIGERVPRRRRK